MAAGVGRRRSAPTTSGRCATCSSGQLDRRLREPRQAERRVLGAGLRRPAVHAAELQRHARRGVHAGARDGALDAHAAVARAPAVRLRRLHDLRRRGAVDAERGAVPRVHARAHDRRARAHRPAAARHRRHRRHVLHAGDVRRLRAAGASAGRGRAAGHRRGARRDLLRPAARRITATRSTTTSSRASPGRASRTSTARRTTSTSTRPASRRARS